MKRPRLRAQEPATLPSVCTLHDVFSQARAQPVTITLFRGWTRLTTDDHGEMQGKPLQGFFAAGTQFLTHYQLHLNGKPVSHRLSTQISSNEWSTVGAVLHSGDDGNLPEGALPAGSLELRVIRRVEDGWSEIITIKNNGIPKRKLRFELRFSCLMGDQEFSEEMKHERKIPWAGLVPRILDTKDSLCLYFKKSYGHRKRAPTRELSATYGDRAPKDGDPVTRELFVHARVLPGATDVRLRVKAGKVCAIEGIAELGARGEVRLLIQYEPSVNGTCLKAPPLEGLEPLPKREPTPIHRPVRFDSSNSTLNLLVGQAMSDLSTLDLPIFGKTPLEQEDYTAYNAGVPRYIGLFGRDNLVTAWQSPLFSLRRIESVLSRLELLQGVARVDWRDEEVDRFPHERRLDPAAQLGKTNRELYYGDVTSTPFWVLTLTTLFRWTGDTELLKRHEKTLRKCVDWILTRLRRENGFIYYAPSRAGKEDENRNQAWKDSGDAIVDENGRIQVPPLAIIEVQGYAYQALLEAAEVLKSSELQTEAFKLRMRFNEKFWMEDSRFYALALDRHGQPIRAKASNVGHILSSGIIPSERIGPVIRELMSEECFSGWGIRTLSEDNPGYDPFSYHRGAVWPIENAFISTGMRLKGFRAEADRITTAQLALSALFQHMRLPEVTSGHPRTDEHPTPGLYAFGNLLQAWSVSAIAQHIQSILGIWPRADIGKVFLNPQLPDWLEWCELHDLEIKHELVSIRFWRENGESHWKVLKRPSTLEFVKGPPSPFAPTSEPSLKAS